MIQTMKHDFRLSPFCCGLGKLTIASWLLTNTMFLLASHVPFVTQISLEASWASGLESFSAWLFPMYFPLPAPGFIFP